MLRGSPGGSGRVVQPRAGSMVKVTVPQGVGAGQTVEVQVGGTKDEIPSDGASWAYGWAAVSGSSVRFV